VGSVAHLLPFWDFLKNLFSKKANSHCGTGARDWILRDSLSETFLMMCRSTSAISLWVWIEFFLNCWIPLTVGLAPSPKSSNGKGLLGVCELENPYRMWVIQNKNLTEVLSVAPTQRWITSSCQTSSCRCTNTPVNHWSIRLSPPGTRHFLPVPGSSVTRITSAALTSFMSSLLQSTLSSCVTSCPDTTPDYSPIILCHWFLDRQTHQDFFSRLYDLYFTLLSTNLILEDVTVDLSYGIKSTFTLQSNQ
jgi:hypothetical protein